MDQTQLWGGAYFPDLSPGPPCYFRFPQRLVLGLWALHSSCKSPTEADAMHQGECSLWETVGRWPVSVLISSAVPGADGAGLGTCAGLSSPPISLRSGSCAQPGPAPDSISCGLLSLALPPPGCLACVPTLRFRRTSQTVPVMFHCEDFTGRKESVPWPISEGRAGLEDVEREAMAGILGEGPVTLEC